MSIRVLLVVVAAVCFALAALGFPLAEINLVAAGLFFWALASLVGGTIRA